MNSASGIGQARVRNFTRTPVAAVFATDSMETAAQKLKQQPADAAAVVDRTGAWLGMISQSELERCTASSTTADRRLEHGQSFDLAHYGAGHSQVPQPSRPGPVAWYMTELPPTVKLDDTLKTAAETFCRHHCQHLVTVDADGEPAGILSLHDVVAGVFNITVEPPHCCE